MSAYMGLFVLYRPANYEGIFKRRKHYGTTKVNRDNREYDG